MVATSSKSRPVIYPLEGKRIFVAGHKGMVGAALMRRLSCENGHLLTAERATVDLRNQAQTEQWFAIHRPQAVFVAAAKVGGIVANNTLRAEFLYDNLAIAMNVIHAAHVYKVEKLLFLGSTCIYPRMAPQPMPETAMLTGPLEATNEPYAIAKIAGVKLAEAYRDQYGCDFISAMPTNLYGPGDNYHPEHSHVVAALIARFDQARETNSPEVLVWGSGTPRREFLYVDDMADACVFLMQRYSDRGIVNIGCGEDLSIAELARTIADVVGYRGKIVFDPSRPDGTPRKLVDTARLNAMGWKATTPLKDGLKFALQAYRHEHKRSASIAPSQ
jgi:GDP-L-fucose synthase